MRFGHRHAHPPSTVGLQSDNPDGVAQARALAGNCNNLDEPATAYAHSYPRSYPIIGPDGTRYHAFRITLTFDNSLDWYHGVQGTTWNNPPILSSPSATKVVHGRKLFLYKDGSRLTQVAWHHDGDAYWVSNTLTENLTNDQMLEIAASLTRYNG